MSLTQRQQDLLLLLFDEKELDTNDELLSPFWDQTGGEMFKPDILTELYELSLLDGDDTGPSNRDIVFLTKAGKVEARKLKRGLNGDKYPEETKAKA
jgi:hypothetical protein